MIGEYTIHFVNDQKLTIRAAGIEVKAHGVFWFYDEVQEIGRVVQKYTMAVPKDNVLYISWEKT